MDAAAADRTRSPASLDDDARLRALGQLICSGNRPLQAAAQLRRSSGAAGFESRVTGSSMGATLPSGVRVRVIDHDDPSRGQIIAFVAAGKTFVHRVRWRGHVGAARGWMITQGDALRLPDPPVHVDQVLGHVDALEQGSGWQPPRVRERLPRRDRLLAAMVGALCALLLEVHPRLAGWLIDRMRGVEARIGWTGAWLYGERRPTAARVSLTYALALFACRLGAWSLSAIRALHLPLMGAWDSGERLLGAFCQESLTLREKARLTVLIYDFFPGYHRTFERLHDWEGPWFERRMPRSPARVLVGGAGVGREAVALAAQALAVDAFDPAPELVLACRRALGPAAHVEQLSYEDFSTTVLDAGNGDGSTDALRARRYRAILLGSGSLTHVLAADEHERLLRACAVLCPEGPILMSFYCEDDAAAAAPEGRAARIGRRIGRARATLRGLAAPAGSRLSYRPHGGFSYTFTRAEIERLAAAVQRTVSWEPGTSGNFRCVTLLRPNPAALRH